MTARRRTGPRPGALRSGSSGTLLRRAALVSSGSAAGQASIVLASFALARWFEPSEFAALGAFLALTAMLSLIAGLHLEVAVTVPHEQVEADAITRLALRLAAGTSAVIVAITAVLSFTGHSWMESATGRAFWLVAPTTLAVTAFNAMGHWAVRRGSFRDLGIARLLLGLFTAGPQLLAGALGLGVLGLVSGPLIGWTTACAYLFVTSRFNPFAELGLRTMDLMRKHRRFPLFGVWSSLLNRGAVEIPAIALLAFYDARSAGLFYFCQRSLIIPANVLGQGGYQSFLNRASELLRSEPSKLEAFTARTVRRVALAITGPVLLGVVLVPWALPFAFGSEWAESGSLGVLLLPMVAGLLVSAPVSGLPALLGHQDLELWRTAARFCGVVAVFLAGAAFDWSLALVVGAYSAVMTAAYLWVVVLGLRITRGMKSTAATDPPLTEPEQETGQKPDDRSKKPTTGRTSVLASARE